ncbi:uncharacterized protein LOC144347800 [Saccoglossus kowalevskii]
MLGDPAATLGLGPPCLQLYRHVNGMHCLHPFDPLTRDAARLKRTITASKAQKRKRVETRKRREAGFDESWKKTFPWLRSIVQECCAVNAQSTSMTSLTTVRQPMFGAQQSQKD